MYFKDFLLEHKKAITMSIGASFAIACVIAALVAHFESAVHGGKEAILAAPSSSTSPGGIGETPTYDYTEAPDHIGENAAVSGAVVRVFTSKSGTTFLDFCAQSSDCPFSAVIFASDTPAFGDLSRYQRQVTLTGIIRSYQGKAEMVLDNPGQIE